MAVAWVSVQSQVRVAVTTVSFRKQFCHPIQKASPPEPAPPGDDPLWPKATTTLPPVPVDLPVLGVSRTWNRTLRGLACVAPFTEQNVFWVHPCGSVCQGFTTFCGQTEIKILVQRTNEREPGAFPGPARGAVRSDWLRVRLLCPLSLGVFGTSLPSVLDRLQ